MISEIEKTVALRYLKPKRKEGFLKIISLFSFLGIALGVAVLIIVMSVMNGFRAELIDKILGDGKKRIWDSELETAKKLRQKFV